MSVSSKSFVKLSLKLSSLLMEEDRDHLWLKKLAIPQLCLLRAWAIKHRCFVGCQYFCFAQYHFSEAKPTHVRLCAWVSPASLGIVATGPAAPNGNQPNVMRDPV